MSPNEFFSQLWQDYVAMAPQADQIYKLFAADNGTVVNDHVAFRTFNLAPINIERLEKHFFAMGYRRHEPYRFDDKKLDAWSYLHEDPTQPRIFLSELCVNELSAAAQEYISGLVAQIDPARVDDPSVFWAGPLWKMPSHADYLRLLEESEYAGWMAAIGMRVNHFTVSINHLTTPTTLQGVVERVEQAGFAINGAGGKLKGTPEQLLEQASTLADRMPMVFADGSTHAIPTCYYEFARRYPDAKGELYQGFIPSSADKIFESTDVKKSLKAA
ncbi:DUF1338 domain-containing protein [Parachitinimonas caeni]|uniref:2-oxoadipate dioxygenase/decarboxylase n=1 Tax=Parachitinimonas caeni TaxID=3031301 RepID=A0ABT7DUM5_9NEIS|nr:DUF1338 domain-containing protein [Parachitinimonas caeni]MDK2123763.1 DUF1338 domain-containing protein [Parachitinimonas caeni]